MAEAHHRRKTTKNIAARVMWELRKLGSGERDRLHFPPDKPHTLLDKDTSAGQNCNLSASVAMVADESSDLANWVEPLVTLICGRLARQAGSREVLRRLIEDGWPIPGELGRKDIDKMIRKPIQHRAADKTAFMIKLVTENRRELLDGLSSDPDDRTQLAVASDLYDLLSGRLDEYRSSREPADRTLAAIKDLLKIDSENLDSRPKIAGQYFGYRRSTTHGTIIRFSLSLREIAKGLYSFESRFKGNKAEWTTTGSGIFSKGNLYLVGHATSNDGSVSRGLRCFALRPDIAQTDSIAGVLLTTEETDKPIAARVVLVPVRNHRTQSQSGGWLPLADLESALVQDSAKWIRSDVRLEEIDDAIDLPQNSPASQFVLQSIRNGTVSTLRYDGCEGNSDSAAENDEAYLLRVLRDTHANPTILYLKAIEGFASSREE